VFNFATASQIAGAYATSEFYGYSNDYVGTYIPRLAALTPIDIFAAAKKHYQWETMTLVVVGDQKKFEKALRGSIDQKRV
jgi:predicted Zn-dependent peptidase